MTLNSFIQAFHFLRPLCLLALPLLWGLVFWLARRRAGSGDWVGVIDPELLTALRLDGANTGAVSRVTAPWPWLGLVWSLAVLALAGPSWQQDTTPAYRAPAAWVVVLDLSPSMEAADQTPNRVTRARYALDDVLGAAHDARVGMVAFSDEAYTVTPLTQDVATIRALLPSLAPDMMPTPGDHLAPALAQAQKLLAASGAKDKRIVILSDGFDDPAASMALAAKLRKQGVEISVIGVGTSGGAPLRDPGGRFARDAQGQPQLARLDAGQLRALAKLGGGDYVDIADLTSLIGNLQPTTEGRGDVIEAKGVEVTHWRDGGAYLLPFILLLAAIFTRRRWL